MAEELYELHIGVNFGIENCNTDLASSVAKASLELSNLATLCRTKYKVSQVPRSKRNDILLKCADVVIDVMQCLKVANGDLPKPTIPVRYDESYLFEPRLCEFGDNIAWLFWVFHSEIAECNGNVDEAYLEEIASLCSRALNTVCIVPIEIGVYDLEPYILERISEHNK